MVRNPFGVSGNKVLIKRDPYYTTTWAVAASACLADGQRLPWWALVHKGTPDAEGLGLDPKALS
jgi:hypothetical protein